MMSCVSNMLSLRPEATPWSYPVEVWEEVLERSCRLGVISLQVGGVAQGSRRGRTWGEDRAWVMFDGHHGGKSAEEAETQKGLVEGMPAVAEDRPGIIFWHFHFYTCDFGQVP